MKNLEEEKNSAYGSPVLDIAQLAKKFRKSPETIKRWCRNNQLPASKLGKSWFVPEEALEQYMATAVQSRCHLRRPQGEQL
jgi:excisionase family DNA binding protein